MYDGAAGKVNLNATYNHNDGFYSEADNLRRQPAYNLVNASVSFSPSGSRVTVRGWVKNLTNDAVVTLLAGTAFGHAPTAARSRWRSSQAGREWACSSVMGPRRAAELIVWSWLGIGTPAAAAASLDQIVGALPRSGKGPLRCTSSM